MFASVVAVVLSGRIIACSLAEFHVTCICFLNVVTRTISMLRSDGAKVLSVSLSVRGPFRSVGRVSKHFLDDFIICTSSSFEHLSILYTSRSSHLLTPSRTWSP